MTTDTAAETSESNRPANDTPPCSVPDTEADDIDAEHRHAQQSGEVFEGGRAGQQ